MTHVRRAALLLLLVTTVACTNTDQSRTTATTTSTSTTSTTQAPTTTTSTAPPGPTRVLVVGDSLGTQLGVALDRASAAYDIEVHNDAILGCGIAREQQVRYGQWATPAYVCTSWPQQWSAALDEFDPDAVIVFNGFWDAFDIVRDGRVVVFGTPEWDAYASAEYAEAMDLLASRGALVIWLQAPYYRAFVEDPAIKAFHDANGFYASALDDARVRHLDDLYTTVAKDRPCQVTIVDSRGCLCPGDVYQGTVDGIQIREGRGVHLTDAGSDELAEYLMPVLRFALAFRC